jgi:hypothetical protein
MKERDMVRGKSLTLVLVLGLALVSAAAAQVAALGPDNPANGFPKYVKDVNGVKLDLPVFPIGDGVTPPTMIFDPPIAGNAWSEATGFGSEAFFFLSQSSMEVGNPQAPTGLALVVMGVEAAYGAEVPRNVPPDQFLFVRLRIRIDAPSLGTYVVTTPWGPRTYVVDTDARRNINDSMDWGGFAPIPNSTPPIASSFERILVDPIPWRFLKGTLATGVLDTEWVGDGVTIGPVTGGFNGVNIFRIDGPNIGGPGVNFVETDQFMVSGHIFQGPDEPRPSATRGAAVIPMF